MTAKMVAPSAIEGLFTQVKKLVPAAVLLGITGDVRHVADGGYHISRSLLQANGMGGDYSIQQAKDKLGNADYSSAIDIGFGGYGVPLIKAVGQRMLAAGRAKDPRVQGVLREFYCCGPSDSDSDVIGWDFSYSGPATTSDLSHRGHLHMSIHREYANDPTALAGIASVIAGVQEDDVSAADVITALKSAEGQALIAQAVKAELNASAKAVMANSTALTGLVLHGKAAGHKDNVNNLDAIGAVVLKEQS